MSRRRMRQRLRSSHPGGAGEVALAVGAADGPLLARVRRLLRVRKTMHLGPSAGWRCWRWACCWPQASPCSRLRAPVAARCAGRDAVGSARGRLAHAQDRSLRDLLPAGPGSARRARRAGGGAGVRAGQLRLETQPGVHGAGRPVSHDQRARAERSGRTGWCDRTSRSFAEPSRDRILLATDRPADQWYGLITHEVAHVFGFDILPGTATPRWIAKVWRSTRRGAWDPSDLVGTSRSGSRQRDPENERASRRWRRHGSAVGLWPRARGVRLHRIALGQGRRATVHLPAAPDRHQRWGSVTKAAFQIGPDEFDRRSNDICTGRFAGPLGRHERSGSTTAPVRIEGSITAISFPTAAGLACIELLVETEGARRSDGGSSVTAERSRL